MSEGQGTLIPPAATQLVCPFLGTGPALDDDTPILTNCLGDRCALWSIEGRLCSIRHLAGMVLNLAAHSHSEPDRPAIRVSIVRDAEHYR